MSSYIEDAIYSVETEIKGLKSVLKSINQTFENVIDTILKTKGKIILTGVGKPSYIAHRVAASLSSTGTPAFYVNANEASHGDMGMISKNDTIIMLSNSGESKELKDIIVYSKKFNISLIGITRNKESFLSKSSTIPVILENIEQTNIVNSPTTSEIMMLSYLDAVITVLIKAKKFTKDDYKVFHPGGKLGINLLKVEELMYSYDKLPLIYETKTISKGLEIMIEKPLGCMLIIDKKDNLKGIITDGDLKRELIKHNDLINKKISTIMKKNIISIKKDMFVVDAVNIMKNGIGKNNNHYIQSLPVVENNKLIGLLHIQECLKIGII